MRERLVVIDDQISPALVQELCGKKIETWRIEDGVCVPDRFPHPHQEPRHGVRGIGRGIPAGDGAGGYLHRRQWRGQVENVCAALEWCLQDGAAVVCMSMGVTCGLDLARMETATRALRQAGCWCSAPVATAGSSPSPQPIPGPVGVKFDPYCPGGAAGGPSVGGAMWRWGCFSPRCWTSWRRRSLSFMPGPTAWPWPWPPAKSCRPAVWTTSPSRAKSCGSRMGTRLFKAGKSLWCGCSTAGEVGSTAGGVFTAKLLAGAAVGSGGDGLVQDGGPVRCLEEAAALLPQLAETAILFLKVPEGNPTVWDYQLDLSQMEPKEACRKVLGFFGEEE